MFITSFGSTRRLNSEVYRVLEDLITKLDNVSRVRYSRDGSRLKGGLTRVIKDFGSLGHERELDEYKRNVDEALKPIRVSTSLRV